MSTSTANPTRIRFGACPLPSASDLIPAQRQPGAGFSLEVFHGSTEELNLIRAAATEAGLSVSQYLISHTLLEAKASANLSALLRR